MLIECGNALVKNGYRIKVFNTINFKKSHHYNPFAYIHSEKDILKLVTTLMANTQGESNSISNQKRVLEAYAEDHGFTNIIHFTDDGISGTRFDRPGFQSMMSEVRAGNVAQMLIKDMSRFGRDYLQVGTYMELLRQNNVRLIAINDGVDTLRGDDEFAPFRNIMNENLA